MIAGNTLIGTGGQNSVEFDGNHHWRSASAAIPTVGSCGTSPSLATGSTDTAGEVETGSTATTSCVITFHVAYSDVPWCTANSVGTTQAIGINATASTLTLSYASGSSLFFTYHCIVNSGG